MLKPLISSLFRLIRSVALVALVILVVKVATRSEPLKSAYTHEEVAKINPVMVIDHFSLVNPENFKTMMQESYTKLVQIGVLIPTPFGPVINDNIQGYTLNVIIQSGGGIVGLGLELEASIRQLRAKGIQIKCHVGEAQSMAFHLMISMCDRVVAKRSAVLMQHRVSYLGTGVSPSTYRTDIELSRREANELGVKYDEWHKLARGPEDHVFTKAEIEKYKLVDEWVD